MANHHPYFPLRPFTSLHLILGRGDVCPVVLERGGTADAVRLVVLHFVADAKNQLGGPKRKKTPCYPGNYEMVRKHRASGIALRLCRRGHADRCISYIIFYGYRSGTFALQTKLSYFALSLGFPIFICLFMVPSALPITEATFSQFVSHIRKGKMLTVITVGCSRPRNRFKSLITSATSMSACKPSPVSRESSFSPASDAT